MPAYGYPLLVAAGFIAGFVNTLAGSGSLVTLPALIFLGLPAGVANGTNRIAILMQNVTAVGSFRTQKVFRVSEGLPLAVPAVVGALVGARIAVELDEETMRQAIGVVMLLMAANVALKPKRWLTPRAGAPGAESTKAGPLAMIGLFFAGMYGGFIQAGVGFFLLACLVLGAGLDLLKANAVKVLIALSFNLVALPVFFLHGQVDWKLGFVVGTGNALGAFVATRLAVKRGVGFLRWFLLAVALASGAALLLGL